MHIISTSQFGQYDLNLEISRGNVLGASIVHKFGRVTGVGTTTAEDIWDEGGTYNFPTAACVVDIQSSSSSDASANEGARTVQIFGLDSNFEEINETISMDGQDQVATNNSYIRLHRMVVRSAGSMGEVAGNIDAVHRGTSSGIARISQGFNQTLMAVYTVPASKTGYLHQWRCTIDRDGINQNRSGDVKIEVRPENEVFQVKDTAGLFNNTHVRNYHVPYKVTSKSDIKMSASATAVNTAFSAGFDLILLDNSIEF
jgi:hypothetical protein